MIRDQNQLKSVKLLVVPNLLLMFSFNCLTVHVSTYVRAAGQVHTPGWLIAETQIKFKLFEVALMVLTPDTTKDNSGIYALHSMRQI
jgi:hypothetical protein